MATYMYSTGYAGQVYILNNGSAADDGDSIDISLLTEGTHYIRCRIFDTFKKKTDYKRDVEYMIDGGAYDASLGIRVTTVEINGRETSRTVIQAMDKFCEEHCSINSDALVYLYMCHAQNDYDKFYRPSSAAMKEYLECVILDFEWVWVVDGGDTYYEYKLVVSGCWTE